MKFHLAAGVALAGLALTLSGCSDSSATDAGKQATTTQQSAPKPPAGGDSKGFCSTVEDGGGADLSKWRQLESDPALREQLTKRFQAMADAAPSELKQSMQDITDAYEKIQSGQVTEKDQDVIAKYVAAIKTLTTWLQTNCPNLKIPTAAAG
jgi:hypothetical protein